MSERTRGDHPPSHRGTVKRGDEDTKDGHEASGQQDAHQRTQELQGSDACGCEVAVLEHVADIPAAKEAFRQPPATRTTRAANATHLRCIGEGHPHHEDDNAIHDVVPFWLSIRHEPTE